MPLDGRHATGVYPADMETLPTAEAAARVGVPNVARFFRLAERHGVKPVLSAPGLRGAKFWSALDVERLCAIVATEAATEASAS